MVNEEARKIWKVVEIGDSVVTLEKTTNMSRRAQDEVLSQLIWSYVN